VVVSSTLTSCSSQPSPPPPPSQPRIAPVPFSETATAVVSLGSGRVGCGVEARLSCCNVTPTSTYT
jgi:hypothetical protein